MARDEIAEFLEISSEHIDRLWAAESLERSIFDSNRPAAMPRQSSVFDVLEFALWSGVLPVTVSKADAAMWVLYLCEMCETECWHTWDLEQRACYIMACATEDGLGTETLEASALVASTLVAAHLLLLNTCEMNDVNVTYWPKVN